MARFLLLTKDNSYWEQRLNAWWIKKDGSEPSSSEPSGLHYHCFLPGAK